MRTLQLAALLAAGFVASPAIAEDGPINLQLEVGQVAPISGFRPICDDPSIATITAEGQGTIKAFRVGTTLCSVSAGNALGPRSLYRVIVVPRPPKGRGPGAGRTGS